MNQQHFNAVFNHLTQRRREVLLKLLANEKDEAIAKSLNIEPATVRKHLEKICREFGITNEFPDQRQSKRSELIALFAKYKPELFNQNTSEFSRTENFSEDKTISENPDFLGREDAIKHLNQLVNEGAKVILIQAEGGVGKTTLATKWFEIQGLEPLELRVGTTANNLNSVKDWIRIKLRDYFQENPEQNYLVMLDQFKSKLQSRKIGVLIDNLEPALVNGKFTEPHRSEFLELFTVLSDNSVQSVTVITSREPINEHEIKRTQNTEIYYLNGLKEEAWQQYFTSRNINIDIDALTKIHQAYGGNAEVMYIISCDILRQYKGNLKVYWKHNHHDLLRNPSLKLLVQSQFEKLKNNEPIAYNIICRLAYYLTQNYPYVPEIWLLCLMWDVPKYMRLRLIDTLIERSLVKENKYGYYLHPVIRTEAVERYQSISYSHTQDLVSLKNEIDGLITSSCNVQSLLGWIHKKFSRIPKQQYNKAAFNAFYLGFVLVENIGDDNTDIDKDKYYHELACCLEPAFEIYCKTPKTIYGQDIGEQLADFIVEKCYQFMLDYVKNNKKIFSDSIFKEYGKINKQILYSKIVDIVITEFSCEIFNFWIKEIKLSQEYINIISKLTGEIISALLQNKFKDYAKNHNFDVSQKMSYEIQKSLNYKLTSVSEEEFKIFLKKINYTTLNSDETNLENDHYFCLRDLDLIDTYIWKSPLTEEDKDILKNYYNANKLLIYCLKSNNYISPEVRSHIEDTLLLPIAEIEKRKLSE